MKDLKKLIASGEQIIGAGIPFGSDKEDIEKLLDYYDYDFISVDSQHSPSSEQYLQKICSIAYELDKPIHYRLDHRRHAYLIGNKLDMGPTSIEVPQTEEVHIAQEARDHFYYKPKGIRSWGGPGRPSGAIKDTPENYPEWWNNTGVLMLQIETLNAINNIPNFALNGVDCFSWGPADLLLDRKSHPEHPFAKTDDDAMGHALQLCKVTNTKLLVRSYDKKLRNRYFDKGVTVLLENPRAEGTLDPNLPFG